MNPTPVPPSPELEREAQEKITLEKALSRYCSPYGNPNPETYAYIEGWKDAVTSREAQLQVAREALTRIIKDSAEHPAVQAIARQALSKL